MVKLTNQRWRWLVSALWHFKRLSPQVRLLCTDYTERSTLFIFWKGKCLQSYLWMKINKVTTRKEIQIESNAFVVISIVNHVIWHVGMFVIFKYHHYSGLYTWHTHDLCHFHPQETIPTIFTSSDLRPGCQVRRKKWRCWKPPARDTWQLQQFSSFLHIFMFISLSYNEEITVTSSDVCSCW